MKALAVAAGIVFWTLVLGITWLALFSGTDPEEPVAVLQIEPAPEAPPPEAAKPPSDGMVFPPGFAITGPAAPQETPAAPPMLPPGATLTPAPDEIGVPDLPETPGDGAPPAADAAPPAAGMPPTADMPPAADMPPPADAPPAMDMPPAAEMPPAADTPPEADAPPMPDRRSEASEPEQSPTATPDAAGIAKALAELEDMARERGAAIGVAKAKPETVSAAVRSQRQS